MVMKSSPPKVMLESSSISVTVSGWAAEQLGHIPEKGDRFTFENLQVTVTKTDGRRLVEACVTMEQPEEEEKQKS